MGKTSAALLCATALFTFHSAASANTLVVNGFGVGGWTSWDTRTAGTTLVGTNDTNAYAVTYFGKPASSSSDTAIAKQIVFMGEGQKVNSAGGATLAAGPSGSLNGLGYVRFDSTTLDSGKSDISYVDSNGIAAATSLIDPNFSLSYHYYIDPNEALHAAGLNISIIGSDGLPYTLFYSQLGATFQWNTASINDTSGLFQVLRKDGTSVGSVKTLSDWSNDSIYKSILFGTGSEIFRIGFSLGNNQKNTIDYLDDMQTNILNGGDVIDFQGPSAGGNTLPAVPLPSAAAMGFTTLTTLAVVALLRNKMRRPESFLP